MDNSRPRFRVLEGRHSPQGPVERPDAQELPAFEEALQAHLDSLFAFALRLAHGSHDRAEDLLQDACLLAFRNYDTLRVPEKIKPWLFRILNNTSINEFHKQARQPQLNDVELTDALVDSLGTQLVTSPENHHFGQLLDAGIQQAIDDLPAELRMVVWLSDVEDLSYKEISEIVNCSVGTVASRLYRGRHILRGRLREYARQYGLERG